MKAERDVLSASDDEPSFSELIEQEQFDQPRVEQPSVEQPSIEQLEAELPLESSELELQPVAP
jgi:hypothetical protein